MQPLRARFPLGTFTARGDLQHGDASKVLAVGIAVRRYSQLLEFPGGRDSLHKLGRSCKTADHSHPELASAVAAVIVMASLYTAEVAPSRCGEIVFIEQIAVVVLDQCCRRTGWWRLMNALDSQSIESVGGQVIAGQTVNPSYRIGMVFHVDPQIKDVMSFELSVVAQHERLNSVDFRLRYVERPRSSQFIRGYGQFISAPSFGRCGRIDSGCKGGG